MVVWKKRIFKTPWHKSNAITCSYNWLYISLFLGGSDDTEPWTSKWLGGVVVKCAEKPGKKYQLSFKALFPFWHYQINIPITVPTMDFDHVCTFQELVVTM